MNDPPRLSTRAERLLAEAVRFDVERDRTELAHRLRACCRPVLESALELQRAYGGLSWGPEGRSNDLGIVFRKPSADPEHHPVGLREPTMVPIGSIAGAGDTDTAYIDEAGEIVTEYGLRSASIEKYIEQAAMLELTPWPRRLQVSIRPPLGAPLAAALGLSPVPEASDVYQQWWRSESVEMRHLSVPGSTEAKADLLQTGSIDEAARVFAVAARLHPGVAVNVSPAEGVDPVHLSVEEAASLPSVDAFAAVPGAQRYPLGTMWDDVTGVVWVVPGADGVTVHRFRLDEAGSIRGWYTLDARGVIGRVVKR